MAARRNEIREETESIQGPNCTISRRACGKEEQEERGVSQLAITLLVLREVTHQLKQTGRRARAPRISESKTACVPAILGHPLGHGLSSHSRLAPAGVNLGSAEPLSADPVSGQR